MKYLVVEIQTMADGTVANLVNVCDTRMQAESTFHSVLAAAAISALPCHAAVMLTSEGAILADQHYLHDVPEGE